MKLQERLSEDDLGRYKALMRPRSSSLRNWGLPRACFQDLKRITLTPPLNILVKLSEVSEKSIDELVKGLED